MKVVAEWIPCLNNILKDGAIKKAKLYFSLAFLIRYKIILFLCLLTWGQMKKLQMILF